mgnify:CR=1 FL=1
MVTTVTTLMIVSLVGFVGYSISNRSNINFWGRRSLFILAYSLVICCFAAARDGLDKTIQYTIDGSCNPGIFSLVSVPNIIGCVGAAIIIIAAIATPIAKSQHMREIWFYVMSGGVMLKIVVMEIARIVQMLHFILEQLSDLEEIHYRAMMGEYLTVLFNAMYDELPVHKSNNKKKSLNDQSIIVG